jgi:aryl-alcohol dehydrogenase-like predicted oxidoreductase
LIFLLAALAAAAPPTAATCPDLLTPEALVCNALQSEKSGDHAGAANEISQIVWSPLGQGVLSGKYDPDKPPPKDSRAASEEMGGFMDRLMQPQVLRAVQELKPIADEAGLTLPQFALAWVLREPNVASAIIGASRPGQVRENAAAAGVVVDTQLFLRAEQIIDEALGRVETA